MGLNINRSQVYGLWVNGREIEGVHINGRRIFNSNINTTDLFVYAVAGTPTARVNAKNGTNLKVAASASAGTANVVLNDPLPTATAPTSVVIAAVADGEQGATARLTATVTGGVYDILTYAWTVSVGTLDDATAASPTWTRPTVESNTEATIGLTVTASGQGTAYRTGTSGSTSATSITTTVNAEVFGISSFNQTGLDVLCLFKITAQGAIVGRERNYFRNINDAPTDVEEGSSAFTIDTQEYMVEDLSHNADFGQFGLDTFLTDLRLNIRISDADNTEWTSYMMYIQRSNGDRGASSALDRISDTTSSRSDVTGTAYTIWKAVEVGESFLFAIAKPSA